MTDPSTLCAPVAVALTLTAPPSPALHVPALTASPGPFGTGAGSPVRDDSSAAVRPVMITPSTENRSLGSTSTVSPAPTGAVQRTERVRKVCAVTGVPTVENGTAAVAVHWVHAGVVWLRESSATSRRELLRAPPPTCFLESSHAHP